MALYQLSISYRSNERPFSTIYDPYPKDRFALDAEAREWATHMAEGMGDEYQVTLLKDGQPLPPPEACRILQPGVRECLRHHQCGMLCHFDQCWKLTQ